MVCPICENQIKGKEKEEQKSSCKHRKSSGHLSSFAKLIRVFFSYQKCRSNNHDII